MGIRTALLLLLVAGQIGALALAEEVVPETTIEKVGKPGDEIIPKDRITDTDCQDCHGVHGFSVPMGKHGESRRRRLDVNSKALKESVHGDYSCMDCHSDIRELPHRKGQLDTVDCVTCHLEQGEGTSPSRRSWLVDDSVDIVVQTKRYTHSIHADTQVENNARCADCHTAHYVYPSDQSRSTTHRLNSPEMCGRCHDESLQEYRMSVHGATIKTPWKGDSATCADCHSAHQIAEKEGVISHAGPTGRNLTTGRSTGAP